MKSRLFGHRVLEPLPLVGRGRGGGRERSEPRKNDVGNVQTRITQIVQPDDCKISGRFLSGRFAPTPTPNPSPQGGGGSARFGLSTLTVAVVLTALTPDVCYAQCNRWTGECDDSISETYDENDIEWAKEAAIDAYFSDCTKIGDSPKRLACYDQAMSQFGYKIEGVSK